MPNVIEALKLLRNEFKFFIVTNQSGIGRGIYTKEDFEKFNNHLINVLKENDIIIEKTFVCPHSPEEGCDCRKPSIKYIKEAEKEFDIDLNTSWVVGDHPHDIEMGKNAGCKTIYILTGHGKKHQDSIKVKPDYITRNLYDASKIILEGKDKIKTSEELRKIVENLKKQNKIIVTTNGVFDILHLGHIKYLEKAKKLGDVLIVAVNSDSSVKQIKGPRRPINNQKARAEVLSALGFVDHIVIFNETVPIKILSEIKPNIHVKGGDYKIEKIIEKGIVEKNNGKIVLIPEIKGYSTTDLINKIPNNYKKQ